MPWPNVGPRASPVPPIQKLNRLRNKELPEWSLAQTGRCVNKKTLPGRVRNRICIDPSRYPLLRGPRSADAPLDLDEIVIEKTLNRRGP